MGKKVGEQAIYTTVGQCINLATDWFAIIVLPGIAGYETTGIYSYCLSIVAVFFGIATFSLRDFQVMDRNQILGERGYKYLHAIMIVVAVVMALFFMVITKMGRVEVIVFAAQLLGQIGIASMQYKLARLQMIGRIDVMGKAFAIYGIAKAVVGIIIFYINKDVLLSIVAFQILGMLSFVIYVYVKYSKLKIDNPADKKIGIRVMIQVWIRCLVLSLSFLIPVIVTSWIKYIVRIKLDNDHQGYYAILVAIASLVPNMVLCITTPLTNLFSELYHEGKAQKLLRQYIVWSAGFCAIYVLGILIGYIPLKWLVNKIYGETLSSRMSVMYISLVAAAFVALLYFSVIILTIYGKSKYQLCFALISLVVCFSASSYLVKCWGLNGAAMTYLVTYCTCGALAYIYSIYLLVKSCLQQNRMTVC